MPAESSSSPSSRRSRRTWWFWAGSVLLHLFAVAVLAEFSGLRQWLFTADSKALEVDASQKQIDEALATLNALYSRRLRVAIGEMQTIVSELDDLQQQRFTSLQRDYPNLVDTRPTALAALAPVVAPDQTDSTPIGELYAQALSTEQRALAAFSRLRSYDLSAIQQLPVSRAFVVGVLSTPERYALDEERLQATITTLLDGRFDALKEELARAHQESNTMLANTERMLVKAKAILGIETGMGDSLFDLTMGDTIEGELLDHDDSAPYLGQQLLPHERGSDGTNVLTQQEIRLGTGFADDGRHAGWLALDSWWVIGPFPHPGRERPEDLDRKYPPESRIDLDAVYEGREGRQLRWIWKKMVNLKSEPYYVGSYRIWYAYTTVYSETEREILACFGSDDYSAAWLNGDVVYVSPKQPQPWTPFGKHSFRMLKLKQGRNHILIKLENAGGLTGFSLLLHTDPEVKL